jgi:metal-responsive CopG/Arc/MetJ family transcriptional regulator
MYMKTAVQVTIDEELLRRIDRDPEARKIGRSAFLRKAAAAYLRRSAAKRLREQYEQAYREPAFPDAFGDWPPGGASWPEE